MDAGRIFPDVYVPSAQSASYHAKWKAANKNGDAPRWETFRDAALAYRGEDRPATPAMATKYGRSLTAAADLHMSVIDIGSFYEPEPPDIPPPPGSIIFEDNFEGSAIIPPWTAAPNGSNGSGTNGSLTLVGAEGGVTPRIGSKMLKAFVSTSNRASWSPTFLQASLLQRDTSSQRSQVGNGNDVYVGFSLYIVSGFQYAGSAHVSLFEWHGTGSGGMSQAPIHFGILGNGSAGQWFIDLHRNQSGYSPYFQPTLGAHVTGTWMDIVIRTKWSLSSDGNVTLWMKPKDGNPMTNSNKVFEYNNATWNLANEPIYEMIGVYRSIQSNAGTVYFDEFRLGTTREIVDPGNYD